MARLLCKCGNTLSNTMAPNNIELIVYSEEEWEEIFNSDVIKPLDIPHPKHEVWKCPSCERVYVFDEKNNVSKVYRLEE